MKQIENHFLCFKRPCTQWGWRFYDYVDIIGADLNIEVPAEDRDDCQPVCIEIPGEALCVFVRRAVSHLIRTPNCMNMLKFGGTIQKHVHSSVP